MEGRPRENDRTETRLGEGLRSREDAERAREGGDDKRERRRTGVGEEGVPGTETGGVPTGVGTPPGAGKKERSGEKWWTRSIGV